MTGPVHLRRRRTFPAKIDLHCPHCGQGDVEVLGEGVLWAHECGAYGYYDDGKLLFPDAIYRVRGDRKEGGGSDGT